MTESCCDVTVWSLDLDLTSDAAELSSLASLLSPDELQRAERFHFTVHRNRFIVCRAALRRLLALAINGDPRTLRLRNGRHGKPELDEEGSDVRFNVSHTEGRGVIAVTRGADVGIDIERMRQVSDPEALSRLVFAEDERRELGSAPDPNRAFLNGWTRKEAFIKALGTGLSEPLRRFSVSLGDRASLQWIEGEGRSVSEWTLVDLSDETHVIALAAHSRAVAVRMEPLAPSAVG